jgi:hypothetical protein
VADPVDEIRARWAAATPGPWSIERHGRGWALYSGRVPGLHGLNLVNLDEWDWNGANNQDAIAAAPSDIATLLAALDTEREARERAERERDEATRAGELARTLAERMRAEVERLTKELADANDRIGVAYGVRNESISSAAMERLRAVLGKDGQ